MASALFGPDGTQAPEPDEVLPDALAAPAMLDGWVPLALPSIPDVTELQRAVSAAMAEQRPDSPASPPPRSPARSGESAPRQPARSRPPAVTQQGPPVARPAAARYPPQPQQMPSPTRGTSLSQRAPSSGSLGYSPVAPPLGRHQPGPPPPALRQPAPAPPPVHGRQRVPDQRVPDQRVPDQRVIDKNPLIQGSGSSGGRIGCIVFLIFVGAAFAKPLLSLIEALLDLFR